MIDLVASVPSKSTGACLAKQIYRVYDERHHEKEYIAYEAMTVLRSKLLIFDVDNLAAVLFDSSV